MRGDGFLGCIAAKCCSDLSMRRALLFVLSFVACTIDSSVQFGSGAGGGPDDVDPITGEPRDSGAHTGGSSGNGNGSSSGEPPPPPHCGDPGAPLCADGEACRGDTDCMSVNCMDALCKQPTSDDNRKNGTESDVDCGGDAAPKCGVGKRCTQHSDCTTDACPSGVCVSSHSCRNHFGGDTCGAGEVGEPNAQHEDCCLSIQPDQQPYRLDKYLITAGRMRAFIDDVRAEFGGVPNVRAWVAAHPDRVPFWNAEWNDSLPSDEGQLVRLIGTGQNPGAGWGSPGRAAGCYVAGNGAPTYWHDDQNVGHAGDIPRGFSREQLDVKALNCTPAGLLAAFCGYDGGRLPTSAEWVYSVRGAQTAAQHELPWGNPPAGASDADVDKHICGAEGIAGGRSGLFNLACVAV